jgi:hypothetical protein
VIKGKKLYHDWAPAGEAGSFDNVTGVLCFAGRLSLRFLLHDPG